MRIFIDASVILAALGSKSGGSALILKLIQKGNFNGIISEEIIEEVQRNAVKIGIKPEKAEEIIILSRIIIIPAPDSDEVEKFEGFVPDEDRHVIASAKKSKAKIVATLDRRLINKAKQKFKNIEFLTPGEILQRFVNS